MGEQPERHETDEERAQREAREEAERLAARAADLAKLPTKDLLKEATDDELMAESQRNAKSGIVRTRTVTTTPRATGHARIDAAREQVQRAAAGAVVYAARGAAKSDGPQLEDLLHAEAMARLAGAPDEFWQRLHDAVDAPAPRGLSEAFADRDYAAEIREEERQRELRRSAIADELEARRVARLAAARPGMAERIAALIPGGKR
ncbi:MAG: hypothetical protein AB7O78_09885 [Thermoleophilia bacterium]